MRKSRSAEPQILGIFKEGDAGVPGAFPPFSRGPRAPVGLPTNCLRDAEATG